MPEQDNELQELMSLHYPSYSWERDVYGDLLQRAFDIEIRYHKRLLKAYEGIIRAQQKEILDLRRQLGERIFDNTKPLEK